MTVRCEAGKTTVLIPTFQRATMLRRCLESVMVDLGDGDRVLVVSDGSTDDTGAVARSFGPRVRFVERPNGGKAAAVNTGLALVETEYCWIFDDDDVVLTGASSRQAHFMDQQPELGFCVGSWEYGHAVDEGGALRGTGAVSQIPELKPRGALLPLFEANYIGGAAMFARTAMLRSLGGLDVRYARSQDYHIAIRAALTHPFAVVPNGPTFLCDHHDAQRGPLMERFPADYQKRKWLRFDQWLYFDLLAPLADERFEEPGASEAQRIAVALTSRARVAASKLLRHAAVDALFQRVSLCPDVLPDDYERRLLETLPLLGHWYGVGVLAQERAFWRGIQEIRRLNKVGAAVADALLVARPSRLRHGLSIIAKGY